MEELECRLCPATNKPWLYIANFGTNSIDRYNQITRTPKPARGQTGSTFVPSGQDGMDHPLTCVVGYDHNLYVSNLETNEVLRYNAKTGAEMPAPGESGATFVDANAGLNGPAGLLFGPDGLLYVANADEATSNVMRFNPNTGAFIDVYAQLTTMGGATGMVFGPDGRLYIGTRFSDGVVRTDGSTIQDFVIPGDHGLSRTAGFVFGPDGNFYVASENTNNVLKFNGITGQFMREFVTAGSGGLTRPAGILFGPDGNLYVSSVDTNSILRYNGRTGAYMDAYISQANGGTISGPREFFFWNTNPTTLNYQPGRTAQGGGDSPDFATADDTAASLAIPPATSEAHLSTLDQMPTMGNTPPVSLVSAAASATPASEATVWNPVAGLSAQPDGLDSVSLSSALDLDLQSWNSPS